jgi:hypothetical protein
MNMRVPAHDASNRKNDFLGLQFGGRDLIKQRGKGVVIVAIQEEHLYRTASKGTYGLKPGEPGS